MTSLSVIVASKGREHLKLTLASIAVQLRPGDELIVDVNDDAPWGHEARNRRMGRARGDALLFIDDDDTYRPDAFATIRRYVEADPLRLHIFRMRYEDGRVLWNHPELEIGNVSTQMVAVPSFRGRATPRWGDRYEGDWDFISATAKGVEPQWHGEVIVNAGLAQDVVRP